LKFILILIFVLAALMDDTGWVRTGIYSFSAPPADSVIVKYLLQVLNENEAGLEKVYGCSLKYPVKIRVPSSDQDYFDLLGSALPDWSGGVALPSRRTIVLRPGAFFDPREYREVILHELGHMYLADKVDTVQVPLWFNEGAAMLVSGKTFSWNDHLVIGNAVIADHLLSLDEMDDMLVFGLAKAQLAYAQSLLAVQYLIRIYGESIIRTLLDGLGRGEDWEQVLTTKTGFSSDRLAGELQRYIHDEYRWALFLQMKNLFWILIVLLFLTGFILVKIRNRRRIREWEKNENI